MVGARTARTRAGAHAHARRDGRADRVVDGHAAAPLHASHPAPQPAARWHEATRRSHHRDIGGLSTGRMKLYPPRSVRTAVRSELTGITPKTAAGTAQTVPTIEGFPRTETQPQGGG